MRIARQILVFDAPDLTAESTFWASLLGGTVDAEDDWHTIRVDGSPRLGIQLAPDHVPPEWPNGRPQQMHLDLYVDDIKTAHDGQPPAAGAPRHPSAGPPPCESMEREPPASRPATTET